MTPPRLLPPTILNESERKESEQMKKQRQATKRVSLPPILTNKMVFITEEMPWKAGRAVN